MSKGEIQARRIEIAKIASEPSIAGGRKDAIKKGNKRYEVKFKLVSGADHVVPAG